MRKKFIIGLVLAFGVSLNLVGCDSNIVKEPSGVETPDVSSVVEDKVEKEEFSSTSSDILKDTG